MLRELRLVGGIEAVELKDDVLTITVDGKSQVYPLTAHAAPKPQKPAKPETPRAPAQPQGEKPNGLSAATGGTN